MRLMEASLTLRRNTPLMTFYSTSASALVLHNHLVHIATAGTGENVI